MRASRSSATCWREAIPESVSPHARCRLRPGRWAPRAQARRRRSPRQGRWRGEACRFPGVVSRTPGLRHESQQSCVSSECLCTVRFEEARRQPPARHGPTPSSWGGRAVNNGAWHRYSAPLDPADGERVHRPRRHVAREVDGAKPDCPTTFGVQREGAPGRQGCERSIGDRARGVGAVLVLVVLDAGARVRVDRDTGSETHATAEGAPAGGAGCLRLDGVDPRPRLAPRREVPGLVPGPETH